MGRGSGGEESRREGEAGGEVRVRAWGWGVLAGGRGGGRGCSQNGQWSARLVAHRRAIPQRAREASRAATYARECGEASKGGQVLIYPI
jgi:hypothetical protein